MALEPINITSRASEIEQAYLKVVRGTSEDTTWVILSPNDKKQYYPGATGSGFKEFLSSFDENKVEFGLSRVSAPGSDVEKLLLVGWCPESAPLKTRASFSANFGTIANNVFRGYHVQVSARDRDDLNERELLMKISNAAGARYSIQQGTPSSKTKPAATTSIPKPRPGAAPTAPSRPDRRPESDAVPAPKPVGLRAGAEPKKPAPTKAEDDWNEPELEKRDFKERPLKPNESSWKPIGRVDLKAVIAEENAKPDPRLVSSVSGKGTQKINASEDIAQLKKQSKEKRADQYEQVLGKQANRVHSGAEQEPSEPAVIPPAKEPVENKENTQDSLADVSAKLQNLSTKPEPMIIRQKVPKSPRPFKESAEVTTGPPEQTGRPLPGLVQVTEKPPATHRQKETSDALKPKLSGSSDASLEDSISVSSISQTVTPRHPPAPRKSPTRTPQINHTAIAEYDYEADEENELTFAEGDLIVNIEFVDSDWWLGELKHTGEKGLFPSNYVQLKR